MAGNVGAESRAGLRRIRGRVTSAAPKAAATAGGRAGETLVKAVLTLRTHQAGTRTPSPPGSPPALISGDLRRSVHRTPTARAGPGIAVTLWGPTLAYGTSQEYGVPSIKVKNFPQLGNPTVGFFGKEVTLPARPFMRPSTVKLVESGTLAKVSAAAFLAALGA